MLLLAYALLGGNPNDLGPLLEPGVVTGPESSELATECKTGQDANQRDDCRILGYVNSIQAYWTDEFAASNAPYVPAKTVLFSGRHPERLRDRERRDRAVLLPARRARLPRPRVLRRAAHAVRREGGSFAQGYVVAHEYGHHVQDLLGHPRRAGQAQGEGPEGGSVRHRAAGRLPRRRLGEPCRGRASSRRSPRTQIADGLDAAAAVGDDRIQETVNGRVDPESWTHGSSEQRQQWFTTGYQGGSARRLRHLQRRQDRTA